MDHIAPEADDYLRYGCLPAPAALLAGLAESQRRTLRLFDHFIALGLQMPKLAIVNPPLWEFGHLAWFHEFWVQRRGDAARLSCLHDADALFNSSVVAHDTRWDLPLPSAPALRAYLCSVFEHTKQRLSHPAAQPDPADAYFIQLSLFHQDMHNEAFAYSWQTTGWPWPDDLPPYGHGVSAQLVPCRVDAADIEVGARCGEGFVFDNEKWRHRVHVPAFTIDSAPVSNGAYLAFVEGDPEQRMPRYWRRSGAQWEQRVRDRWRPLDHDAPVCHVSAVEADAYCAWAGRRLPTEFEWLRFATAIAPAQAFAGVWEWTSSLFAPFPGFRADPYADYSRPWFDGRHRVLKGGSCWTAPRLRRAGYRNFYLPERGDVFSGFRTCAIDA